ncbi:hypothetical protein MMC29_002170 [Sticta canariensis]|nr:hypothetical protein [Sticta canariensis]
MEWRNYHEGQWNSHSASLPFIQKTEHRKLVILRFARDSPMSSNLISPHRKNGSFDEAVAAFLNKLRPHSLDLFETLGCGSLGLKTFRALSCQGDSLIQLKLQNLSSSAILKVPALKGCINLVSLALAGDKKSNVLGAPALMAPIFLDVSIHLTTLRYTGVVMRDAKKFYRALANQLSLQTLWLAGVLDDETLLYSTRWQQQNLWLKGNVNEDSLDADILVESLSQLFNLKALHLVSWISTSFEDQHIMQLASSLPKLEIRSTSEKCLTDAIWGEVASLRSLQRLDLGPLAIFTVDGILDFIEKLGPGNIGLDLFVKNIKPMPWTKGK